MRRDFRYTGIHNIQNNLKFRRNFRWKAGLPLKKIRIQRVSVFDIAVTLLLAVVIIALAVRGTRELAKMKTTTDDYIQCETLARQLQSGSDYLVAFTDRENPGQSIFKDADQALYQVKQNGRHGWARMPCRAPSARPACPKKCGCSTSHRACRKGSTAFML